jgi:hypothetical protein
VRQQAKADHGIEGAVRIVKSLQVGDLELAGAIRYPGCEARGANGVTPDDGHLIAALDQRRRYLGVSPAYVEDRGASWKSAEHT